jgi:hypothetical protein
MVATFLRSSIPVTGYNDVWNTKYLEEEEKKGTNVRKGII